MKPQSQDEILNYVLRPENLSATMDIVKRSGEIRCAALDAFWTEVQIALKKSTPSSVKKRPDMKWELWSQHDRPDATYRELYYRSIGKEEPRLSLHHAISHYLTETSFVMRYGIEWSEQQPIKSAVHSLPQIERLRLQLEEGHFNPRPWWVGYAKLFPEEPVEDFLKRYARNPKQINEKVCRDFWQMVKDTLSLVDEANRAIRRARIK